MFRSDVCMNVYVCVCTHLRLFSCLHEFMDIFMHVRMSECIGYVSRTQPLKAELKSAMSEVSLKAIHQSRSEKELKEEEEKRSRGHKETASKEKSKGKASF